MPRPVSEILAQRHSILSGAADITVAYLKAAEAQFEVTKELIEAAVREALPTTPVEVLELVATIDGRKDPAEVLSKLKAAMASASKFVKVVVEPNTLQIKFYGHAPPHHAGA